MKARGLTSARRAYRMMAALLALVTLSVLGGCGAKGDDVATIGRGEVEVSAAPGASTDALVSCLVDAGLPARLDEGLDGGVQLGWDEGHDIAVVDTYGGDWWIRDASRDYDEVGSQADHSRFLNAHQPDGASPYGLEVDGVDYSDVFATCVQNSGYAPVSESKDVRDEQVAKQALAEVTNDWLVCARENGYSDWPDVEAGEADDWLTSPQVSIPLSTSADELRNLLAACPNFDDETAKRLEDPEFDWSVDFAAQPAIEIEPPKPPMDDDEVAVQEAEYTHYLELVDILGQAEVEFYERRAQAESEQ